MQDKNESMMDLRKRRAWEALRFFASIPIKIQI